MSGALRAVLRKWVEAGGAQLPLEDFQWALEAIVAGEYEAEQLGAFLMALYLTKMDRDPEIIALTARVLQSVSLPLRLEEQAVADIVGTGGDGQDTFNVSTTAALVAAGAGLCVCKHGNKAASSTSGSADLLLALQCPVTTIPVEGASTLLTKTGFHFLFAPLYHPALARVAPIRRALGFPTIFNILGPLINPARPRYMVLGVHSASLGQQMCQALGLLGVQRAWVVCGRVPGGTCGGLDEISPQGPTDVWELLKEEDAQVSTVKHFVVEPKDFGLEPVSLETVRGGTSTANAVIVEALFDPENHDRAPLLAVESFVLLNAAALLYVAGMAQSLPGAVDLARTSMVGGNAARVLATYRAASQLVVQST